MGALGLLALPAHAERSGAERFVSDPLFARIVGNGDPILFIHGLAATTAYWGRNFDRFAQTNQLVFVDLAGFGRSLKKPGPFDLEGQLRTLARFREQKLGDRPITLVGHSFGALLATLAASRWTNVRGVAAFSLPVLEGDLTSRWQRVRKMDKLSAWVADDSGFGEISCKIMCATRPLVRELGPLIDRGVPADVARAAFDHHWHSLRGALDSAVAANPRGWVAQTEIPFVVVQGSADDVATPATVRRALTGLHVDIRETAAGHQAPLEGIDACVAAIADVLASDHLRR